MWRLSAIDARTPNSTARWFSTGNDPGIPRQTGQTLVLGGAPNCVEQPQKILVCVSSWTCTSSPITGSYFSRSAEETCGLADMKKIIGPFAGLFLDGNVGYCLVHWDLKVKKFLGASF